MTRFVSSLIVCGVFTTATGGSGGLILVNAAAGTATKKVYF